MPSYSHGLITAKEETEARTVTKRGGKDSDSPDYLSASYREQADDVRLIRDVYGGTKALRKAGKKYLPRHPMESTSGHQDRVNQAVAFNALKRTVRGLVGMIFRRDPARSDEMPTVVGEHLDNIDMRGNSAGVFLRQAALDAMLDGHTWIHVESPRVEGVRNNREADDLGIRPYWINITKSQAINWRYAMRGGRPVLTLFVYREDAVEPSGDFGEQEVNRIRVLREGPLNEDGTRGNVRGELHELRETDDKEKGPEWVKVEEYQVGVAEIPVAVLYANRMGEFTSTPPLLDLAYEQLEYYRVRSDRQRSMTFSSIAKPYLFGDNVMDADGEPKIKWAPGGMLVVNDSEAEAGIIESHGYGLDATREELREIKENMAALGLRMLMDSSGAQPRTATSDILEKSESDASLASFAVALDNAANRALELHAAYESRIDDPGTIRVNRDFQDQMLSPQMLKELRELWKDRAVSLETLWDRLVAGEVLDEDFDPELERERIEVTQPMDDLVALAESGRRGPGEEPPLPEEGA